MRKSQTHRIIRTNGQRIAYTNTSRIPSDDIVDAVKFVAQHAQLHKTAVHFKKAGERRWSYGRAFNGLPSIMNSTGLDLSEWDYLITITDHRIDYVSGEVINTLAHEAKHIEQFRRGEKGSEPPCNAFGAFVARRWLLQFIDVPILENLA